jgi:hypothetical protein
MIVSDNGSELTSNAILIGPTRPQHRTHPHSHGPFWGALMRLGSAVVSVSTGETSGIIIVITDDSSVATPACTAACKAATPRTS